MLIPLVTFLKRRQHYPNAINYSDAPFFMKDFWAK